MRWLAGCVAFASACVGAIVFGCSTFVASPEAADASPPGDAPSGTEGGATFGCTGRDLARDDFNRPTALGPPWSSQQGPPTIDHDIGNAAPSLVAKQASTIGFQPNQGSVLSFVLGVPRRLCVEADFLLETDLLGFDAVGFSEIIAIGPGTEMRAFIEAKKGTVFFTVHPNDSVPLTGYAAGWNHVIIRIDYGAMPSAKFVAQANGADTVELTTTRTADSEISVVVGARSGAGVPDLTVHIDNVHVTTEE